MKILVEIRNPDREWGEYADGIIDAVTDLTPDAILRIELK